MFAINNLQEGDVSSEAMIKNKILELKELCDALEVADQLGEEGLGEFLKKALIRIGDLMVGLVKLNTTNFATIFQGFKRSELRAYMDKFHISNNMIEHLDFTKVMDARVAKPTGLKSTVIDAVQWVGESYKKGNYLKTSDQMTKDIKSVFEDVASSVSNETFTNKLSNKGYTSYYKNIINTIEKLNKDLGKLFEDTEQKNFNDTGSAEFKEIYKSMTDFKNVTRELLGYGSTMISLRNLSELADKISEHIDGVIKNIEAAEYKPGKEFVTDLAFMVRTIAMSFDLAGTTIKTQMILEHNHTLVYTELDKFVTK